MEKLQAALDKARQQRQKAAPQTSPLAAPVVQTGADTLWHDLAPFDVSQEVLRKHRVVTQNVGSSEAAPFDILRTKLLVQMRKHGWKRIAITSPMPESGKTTMACNLALGFGRQSELRSILLDMDLRDPSVNHYYGVTPERGIGEVLTGKVAFADQALRLGENVAVSMARQVEADPARILHAQETMDILADIEDRYQPNLMIFDMPSVLVNDDTRSFLKNVDCALIVIRASVTKYTQFDSCEKEIGEQTNIIGTVLNGYTNVGS